MHVHFDPCSGVAGDMTVAALVDAGVPQKVVRDAIRALGLRQLKVGFEARKRGAFAGLGFTVDFPGKDHGHDHAHDHDHDDGHDHAHAHDNGHVHAHGHDHRRRKHETAHEHRDYGDIRRLLRRAALDRNARSLAEDIFARLADAEARMHGIAADKVRFHEVGAWDSIADVVGAAAALAWLAPASVSSTPPVLGTGTIRTAHGLMPVPAPATVALLRGKPVLSEGHGELTTPTGAAILASVVQSFGCAPPMLLASQGFGAGTREQPDRANVLRVLLGEPVGNALPASHGELVQVTANIDDMNPQLAEPLMSALFGAGAVDVWIAPVYMKKGRPAMEVSALCPPDGLASVEDAFFLNSTSLGVRRHAVQRTVLERAMTKVDTSFGSVRVKVASRQGVIFGATPEFDDCRALAKRANVPVRRVSTEAAAVAWKVITGRKKRSG